MDTKFHTEERLERGGIIHRNFGQRSKFVGAEAAALSARTAGATHLGNGHQPKRKLEHKYPGDWAGRRSGRVRAWFAPGKHCRGAAERQPASGEGADDCARREHRGARFRSGGYGSHGTSQAAEAAGAARRNREAGYGGTTQSAQRAHDHRRELTVVAELERASFWAPRAKTIGARTLWPLRSDPSLISNTASITKLRSETTGAPAGDIPFSFHDSPASTTATT